tara:strand:- start:2864 stop:3247 length:384 start_codon:yes stop_codon:yes gene_type:complete
MVLTSCSNDELYDDVLIPTIELDGRLPMDSNGYYHLTLNQATNQTTHRITGRVLNTTEPTKVSWKSNLSWEYQGENVPTVNGASYVSDVGEVNTMIAPIRTMVGDTLRVEATVREWLITKQINIVLE